MNRDLLLTNLQNMDMSREIVLLCILILYFGVLFLISSITSKKASAITFFTADKKASWYLVAYGMIGASLSGVTFISVPGAVNKEAMSYLQVVLGYLLGYFIIIKVLLPLYYKQRLVSIYTYLADRYGFWSYKTGAFFFIISRVIGASFRLFLVAAVLQLFFFDRLAVPFWLTVTITLLLIWLYTFKGGIKTIVITDTIQTSFMLLSVFGGITIILSALDMDFMDAFALIADDARSQVFFWDWKEANYFPKQFAGGALIALAMTGLDQDMMQKNLTCKTLKESQKNMLSMSLVLVVVNIIFLGFGVLMYLYAEHLGLASPSRADYMFPSLALYQFPLWGTALFLIGIVAAAYSSADSALTALTTSFYIDILGYDPEKEERKRYLVHILFSVLIFLVILIFERIEGGTVISAVLKVAGYTYGPLLGLYSFGIITTLKPSDHLVPFVCLVSPLLTHLISLHSEAVLFGYMFGYELLLVNGLITFLGLWFISIRRDHANLS